MVNKKEKQILRIIRYLPPIFVIASSIVITLILFTEKKRSFNKEKTQMEKIYIENNKKIIKEEIDKIYTFIKHLQRNAERDMKSNVKEKVYKAHMIANNIYKEFKDKKTKKEVIDLIKLALGAKVYKYEGNYYFMDDEKGVSLLNPSSEKSKNNILPQFDNIKENDINKSIYETIKTKTEKFNIYYWYKRDYPLKRMFKKISFYKYFEPYNLVISAGEYFIDCENRMREKVIEYIELLKSTRANELFVINYNGYFVYHKNSKFINKKYKETSKNKQMEIILRKIEQFPKDGFFFKFFKSSKTTKAVKKEIGFGKSISNWKWFIGTTFNEDDIKEMIENRKNIIDLKFNTYIKKILLVGCILTFILLLLSIYISYILQKKFYNYNNALNKRQALMFQQSKMIAMGEMIGNIAHQWRQPLSTITTAITGMILQKKLENLSDEVFYDTAERINKSAQYLSTTIDDFRNYFSPNKIKNSFFIDKTIRTVLELTDVQIKKHKIRVIKKLEKLEICTHENELIQALLNIINNAKDELSKLEKKEKFIFIDITENEENVFIKIKDNAGGIAIDIIDRIFEPYFTTKHQSQGTGIGLYMTEEIIKKHLLGEIYVNNVCFNFEDKEYEGAEFIIELKK